MARYLLGVAAGQPEADQATRRAPPKVPHSSGAATATPAKRRSRTWGTVKTKHGGRRAHLHDEAEQQREHYQISRVQERRFRQVRRRVGHGCGKEG